MARLLGPDANGRLVYVASASSALRSAAGLTAVVYAAATGSTLADIATYDGTGTPGATITDSELTVDSDSLLPRYWFPNGVDTVYVSVGGGTRVAVNADYDARLDAVLPLAGGTMTGPLVVNSTVGINVTSPAASLDVVGTSSTPTVLGTKTSTSTSNPNFGSTTFDTASRAFDTFVTGETAARWAAFGDGKQEWGDGATRDTNLYRSAANVLKTDDKLVAAAGIGVGNSAAATTPGTVTRKIEVFDAAGASLGFIPVYDAIT